MQCAVWRRCEITLQSSKDYANPFLDVEIMAEFVHESGDRVTLPGYWNGEKQWKVRFCPEKEGAWQYSVSCNDMENAGLHGVKGTIEATPSLGETVLEQKGFVRLEQGKRYFTYGDGTPFFWLGDTHWQMPDYERIHECNYPGCKCGNQFKHLADDRIEKGFNVYQTYFNSSRKGGGPEKDRYPWWTEAYERINPQAFNDKVDYMMDYLADHGVTIAMGFGLHTGTPAGFGRVEPLLAFVRYCVARYACYPIVWITAQEITDERHGAFAMWMQAAELVSQLDGYHRPEGAHMYPFTAEHPLVQRINAAPWHQWWTLQAGHGGLNNLKTRRFYQSYFESEPTKPYLETECQYEDIYCCGFNGYEAARAGAWKACQSGSAGFTYGVTGVWAMGWNQVDDCGWPSYSPEPWFVGMDKPGSLEVAHMRRFYEYVGFQRLTPSFDYRLGGFEARGKTDICHFEDKIYVVYFYDYGRETGVLHTLNKEYTYTARWFDPIAGKFIDLGTFRSSDGTYEIPLRPNERDWVLLVTSLELGDFPTMPMPQTPAPIMPKDADLSKPLKIQTIKASSQHGEHPIELALDGQEDTWWTGFAPKTSQTITLELETEQPVSIFEMQFTDEEQRALRYRIEGSKDGKAYDILLERAGGRIVVGGQYRIVLEPLQGEYKYIRLFINSSDLPCVQLSKLAVYA